MYSALLAKSAHAPICNDARWSSAVLKMSPFTANFDDLHLRLAASCKPTFRAAAAAHDGENTDERPLSGSFLSQLVNQCRYCSESTYAHIIMLDFIWKVQVGRCLRDVSPEVSGQPRLVAFSPSTDIHPYPTLNRQ